MVLMGFALVGLTGVTLGGLCLIGVVRGYGLMAKLRYLLLAMVFGTFGSLCLGLELALHAFQAFEASAPVAEVRTRWVGEQAFELTWTPVKDNIWERPVAQTFQLKGDQWAVSGGIVKWAPWLTAIGFASYHKPTRISGRYVNTVEETQTAPTAYDLNGGMDSLWWWFYRMTPYLPFIHATYGSTAYTFANPAIVCEVSITPSGYMIASTRPQRPAARRRAHLR